MMETIHRATAEPQWFEISDVIDMLLNRLSDGKDLARCLAVNRLWHAHATSETLWQQLLVQRWCMKPTRLDTRHARKKYAQWNRTSRQPSTSYSGDKFPAFAMSEQRSRLIGRSERYQATALSGNSQRHANLIHAGVWALCSHTPDCTMPFNDEGQKRLLGLHLVVQNFGQVPITVTPDSAMLRLKTGTTYFPSFTSTHRFLAVAHNGVVTEDASKLGGKTQVVMKQWDFVVIGTCYFVMPPDIRFEHDALEQCEELVIELEEKIHSKYTKIVAKFDDLRIWKHYTKVNPQFWVFSERPNLDHGSV